jgi:hypothetical protein
MHGWVRSGHLEKLIEVIGRLPHLALEITLGSGNELHVGIVSLLVVVTTAPRWGCCFGPLLVPLALLFMPLLAALIGAPRLSLGTALSSLWMKTTLTASSREACLVAMSSNFFVVFG